MEYNKTLLKIMVKVLTLALSLNLPAIMPQPLHAAEPTLMTPEMKVTRAMIVTDLYRQAGEPDTAQTPLAPFVDTDSNSSNYNYNAVVWAAQNNIISGYGGGVFGPNDNITREQIAAILYRYALYAGMDVSAGENTNILSYEDAFDISEYAIPALQWACAAGVISDKPRGYIDPSGELTHAEFEAMFLNFLEALTKESAMILTRKEAFNFGKQAHAFHPETVDEFIPVFASQLARYNQIAFLLWPDNAVVNQSAVLEDVDTHRFWFVAPDGAITSLMENDIEAMGVTRRATPDDFSFYEGGTYITISEQSVREQMGGEKLHVGAYDAILWLTHEGFHKLEQEERWKKPEFEDIPNPDRNEFLTNIDARVKRNLLQRLIMRAVADPGNTSLILDALATYEEYKIQNPDDYRFALYWEQIEGTALYYEAASSLFIFYPDQVDSKEDLARAFAYLATHEDKYIAIGLVSESYNLGLFAGALLDRLDENWKKRVMQEPLLTPLEILSSYYEGIPLPEPKQFTQDEIEIVTAEIQERVRFLAERQVFALTMLKQNLDSMPEEERAIMEMFIMQTLQNFEEMIKILPAEEQKAREDFIKAIKE